MIFCGGGVICECPFVVIKVIVQRTGNLLPHGVRVLLLSLLPLSLGEVKRGGSMREDNTTTD